MIRHIPQKQTVGNHQERQIEFDTFHFRPQVGKGLDFSQDSLLFTQSKRTQDIHRQLGIANYASRQNDNYSKQSKYLSRRVKDVIIEQTLSPYLIQPFEHLISENQTKRNKSVHNRKDNQCCQQLSQYYHHQISFLTKNNQELYETVRTLSIEKEEQEQLSQKLGNYNKELKELNKKLEQNNQALLKTVEQLEGYYKQKQITELRLKKENIIAQAEQMKMINKLTTYFKQHKSSEKRNASRHDAMSTQKKDKQNGEREKRTKTEYCQQDRKSNIQIDYKGTQTELKSDGMKTIYTQRFTDDMERRLLKLSQQKKEAIKISQKGKMKLICNDIIKQSLHTPMTKKTNTSRTNINTLISICDRTNTSQINRSAIKTKNHKK